MATNSPFKNDALKGKVALITGGGTGINFGIGQILGAHGCAIAITGRRENVLKEAVQKLQSQGIKAFGVQGDVRSVESATNIINAVVKEFGRLDILINGAAGNFLCPAENLTTNAFKTVVEIDLIGTFNMSRAAFEELKKTKGSIINISATLHYSTTPWQVHASAAKAGVDSITTSLAAEWGEYGIRVNGVAPGPIKDTVGMEKLSLGVPPNQLEEAMSEYVPLRKMGTKDDIGYAALYLASGAANYVTGDTIVVDGGAWLYHTRFISREALTALDQERRKKAKL